MKTIQIWSCALLLTGLAIALNGCNKGPAERTGEKLDRAVQRTGDKIEDTADKARQKVD